MLVLYRFLHQHLPRPRKLLQTWLWVLNMTRPTFMWRQVNSTLSSLALLPLWRHDFKERRLHCNPYSEQDDVPIGTHASGNHIRFWFRDADPVSIWLRADRLSCDQQGFGKTS